MTATDILDVVLVVLLALYTVNGYRSGLVRSALTIVGLAAGAALAVLLIPWVTRLIEFPALRLAATLALTGFLLLGGSVGGSAAGSALQHRLGKLGVRVIDRIASGLLSLLVAALVVSMTALSIGSLGVPGLSPAIGSSRVVRAIDLVTPDAAKAVLAQLRSATLDQGLPGLVQALGGPSTPPQLPEVDTSTSELEAAGASVVRITGNAFACGQSQSGSGWVVSKNRVITNAHVVAGVAEPVVEVRGGGAHTGRVVYFDPEMDLAVIAVPRLGAPALGRSATLEPGSDAIADGFPFGGPYQSKPARVLTIDTVRVADIYGGATAQRQIYNLAVDVQQGNSGGPLLATDGTVAGVIFAKAATTANVGYALTMAEVEPVAIRAPDLRDAVDSGRCIRE